MSPENDSHQSVEDILGVTDAGINWETLKADRDQRIKEQLQNIDQAEAEVIAIAQAIKELQASVDQILALPRLERTPEQRVSLEKAPKRLLGLTDRLQVAEGKAQQIEMAARTRINVLKEDLKEIEAQIEDNARLIKLAQSNGETVDYASRLIKDRQNSQGRIDKYQAAVDDIPARMFDVLIQAVDRLKQGDGQQAARARKLQLELATKFANYPYWQQLDLVKEYAPDEAGDIAKEHDRVIVLLRKAEEENRNAKSELAEVKEEVAPELLPALAPADLIAETPPAAPEPAEETTPPPAEGLGMGALAAADEEVAPPPPPIVDKPFPDVDDNAVRIEPVASTDVDAAQRAPTEPHRPARLDETLRRQSTRENFNLNVDLKDSDKYDLAEIATKLGLAPSIVENAYRRFASQFPAGEAPAPGRLWTAIRDHNLERFYLHGSWLTDSQEKLDQGTYAPGRHERLDYFFENVARQWLGVSLPRWEAAGSPTTQSPVPVAEHPMPSGPEPVALDETLPRSAPESDVTREVGSTPEVKPQPQSPNLGRRLLNNLGAKMGGLFRRNRGEQPTPTSIPVETAASPEVSEIDQTRVLQEIADMANQLPPNPEQLAQVASLDNLFGIYLRLFQAVDGGFFRSDTVVPRIADRDGHLTLLLTPVTGEVNRVYLRRTLEESLQMLFDNVQTIPPQRQYLANLIDKHPDFWTGPGGNPSIAAIRLRNEAYNPTQGSADESLTPITDQQTPSNPDQ